MILHTCANFITIGKIFSNLLFLFCFTITKSFHSIFFSILTSRATRHINLLTSLLIKLLRKPMLSICCHINFKRQLVEIYKNVLYYKIIPLNNHFLRRLYLVMKIYQLCQFLHLNGICILDIN